MRENNESPDLIPAHGGYRDKNLPHTRTPDWKGMAPMVPNPPESRIGPEPTQCKEKSGSEGCLSAFRLASGKDTFLILWNTPRRSLGPPWPTVLAPLRGVSLAVGS